MLEQMLSIEKKILDLIEEEVNTHIEDVCAGELGEAVDIIKDFSEAIYYHTIVASMNEKKEVE